MAVGREAFEQVILVAGLRFGGNGEGFRAASGACKPGAGFRPQVTDAQVGKIIDHIFDLLKVALGAVISWGQFNIQAEKGRETSLSADRFGGSSDR
jgi:hypothetical protein